MSRTDCSRCKLLEKALGDIEDYLRDNMRWYETQAAKEVAKKNAFSKALHDVCDINKSVKAGMYSEKDGV